MLAHRASYLSFNGLIPDGMVVMHSCDNKICVNPEHLSVGTQSDNIKDCSNKGRIVDNKGEKHGNSKLTKEQVLMIRNMELSSSKIGELFGVCSKTVLDIRSRKLWKHV